MIRTISQDWNTKYDFVSKNSSQENGRESCDSMTWLARPTDEIEQILRKSRGVKFWFSPQVFIFSKHQITVTVPHCLLICHNLPLQYCLQCLRQIAQPAAAVFTQTSWICCSQLRDFWYLKEKYYGENSSVRFTRTLLLNLSFHTTTCQEWAIM